MTGSAFARRALAGWPWAAAASTGVLLSLCLPGWNQGWLCWIALTPLICALWFPGGDNPGSSRGRLLWLKNAGLGFCAGVVFFCMSFFWLTTVTDLMPPFILGRLAWFGLMCYMALYPALWGWFTGCVAFRAKTDSARLLNSAHNLWLGVICASAWVAQEWLRGVVFSGFGWNNLSVSLHDNIPLIQIVDITGTAGLSFLIALCNVIAVVTVRRFAMEIHNRKFRPHFDFTLTIMLVCVVFVYGVQALRAKPGASIPLRVTAIQADIPETEKFDSQFEDMIFARYRDLTDEAMITPPEDKPQLIIWPEAATPAGMFADDYNHNFVWSVATRIDTNFLLGTLDSDDKYDYNVAVLIPQGVKTDEELYAKRLVHRKMHLVPFGEYIPFRHSFPLFAKLAGNLVPGDFQPGTDYNLLQTQHPAVKIGTLICFEDTLGDLTRHFVLNGAQMLVNITNDGWFLKSIQSQQHVANAVFRAVENRRPLVRCANTGVTCYIDSNGVIDTSLHSKKGDTFVEGFLPYVVQVPVDGPVTFYARHGEWLSICALILALVVIVAHFFQRRRA